MGQCVGWILLNIRPMLIYLLCHSVAVLDYLFCTNLPMSTGLLYLSPSNIVLDYASKVVAVFILEAM